MQCCTDSCFSNKDSKNQWKLRSWDRVQFWNARTDGRTQFLKKMIRQEKRACEDGSGKMPREFRFLFHMSHKSWHHSPQSE